MWWRKAVRQAFKIMTDNYQHKLISKTRLSSMQNNVDIYIGFDHLKELTVSGSVAVTALSAWTLLIEIYYFRHFDILSKNSY